MSGLCRRIVSAMKWRRVDQETSPNVWEGNVVSESGDGIEGLRRASGLSYRL